MRNTISKTIVAGLGALSVAALLAATVEPASAQNWRGGGGGWHGGGGGWHGGGGGWHGGYGGWHGGYGRGAWHNGYWRGGSYYNGWWGPAIVAGLAAGAIATYPYYSGYGYGYGNCWQVRPTYDGYGNYIGDQSVNVCR